MKKLIRSFDFAFKGISYAFATQQNFRIHVFAAIIASGFGYFLRISADEWQWVMLCIMLMLVAELLNTAIEALVDLVSPGYNKLAGHVKDISAAAVLIIAFFRWQQALLFLYLKFYCSYMLHKTRGIVFKTTDYSESSVVVQIFTEKFGLQSYIINGARKPKAKIGRNMLQTLSLVDMVVYHKAAGNIQRIAELKNSPLLQSIPYDVIKSCLAMFLNEVLYKAIKQQTADENCFDFIFNAIELLDNTTRGLANFHLVFLIQLTRYLGFYPHGSQAATAAYFDMKNGIFSPYKPESTSYLSPPHTSNFYNLLKSGFGQTESIKLSNDERRYLISKLLEYYVMHIEGFGNIKSHEVLEEVLG